MLIFNNFATPSVKERENQITFASIEFYQTTKLLDDDDDDVKSNAILAE